LGDFVAIPVIKKMALFILELKLPKLKMGFAP
jgi:hypothetical protein